MNNPVPEHMNDYLYPLVGTRMLELGNKKTGGTTYKSYFESKGIDHTSIDWNGLDGAIKLDLRQPIEMEPFDMVTNIGTSEHVSNQYGVWFNIHNLCKVGGIVVSHTPLEGDWWWHGLHYPRMSFFEQFAEMGYEINFIGVGQEAPTRTINVRMKKTHVNEFVMPPMETIYRNIPRSR